MAWSNQSLLWGTLLVAAPIVLHLLLKQRPKRIAFPATRFVLAGKDSTRRRMRLQHLILLMLRCLVIVVAAAALARPSVATAVASRWSAASLLLASSFGLGLLAFATRAAASSRTTASAASRSNATNQPNAGDAGARWLFRGLCLAAALTCLGGLATVGSALTGGESLLGDQEAPIAAALVFDTSPRMELIHANQTAVERSRELALRLLRELPSDSQTAVLDSRRRGSFWAADRGAARAEIERLESTGAPQDVLQVAIDAVQLAAESELERKEVYLFSDLSAAAWTAAGMEGLRRVLDDAPEVALYIMDVGVEDYSNLALGDLKLSSVTLPRSGELTISTELAGVGVGGDYQVRLEIEDVEEGLPLIQDGETKLPALRPRDRQTVSVGNAQPSSVQLKAVLKQSGIRHGRVVIEDTGVGDSLSVDNVRYFTVDVREAWPVLIVTGPDASADFVAESLAPGDFQDFQCVVARQSDLATQDMSRFAAVCLLDPAPMEDALWARIASYVTSGGGLWVQLGRNARSDSSFNGPAAQKVLGAPLLQQWRAGSSRLFVAIKDRSHPALAFFRDAAADAPWPILRIHKHWVLDPLPDSARVLTGFSANRYPWTFEWPVGSGRVAVSSTPLSDVTYSKNAWNELAYGENNWPPFVLCNELMLYLVRGSETRLNFATGETVELPNDDRTQPRRYQLFLPSEPPQDVTSLAARLRIPYTASPGQYRLKGARGGLVVRGFSCNLPADATRLQRVDPQVLQDSLGEDRFQLADDYSQLQRVQNRQRVGREFFSLLMVLLAGVLVVEFLMANRFYKTPSTSVVPPKDMPQLAGGAPEVRKPMTANAAKGGSA